MKSFAAGQTGSGRGLNWPILSPSAVLDLQAKRSLHIEYPDKQLNLCPFLVGLLLLIKTFLGFRLKKKNQKPKKPSGNVASKSHSFSGLLPSCRIIELEEIGGQLVCFFTQRVFSSPLCKCFPQDGVFTGSIPGLRLCHFRDFSDNALRPASLQFLFTGSNFAVHDYSLSSNLHFPAIRRQLFCPC